MWQTSANKPSHQWRCINQTNTLICVSIEAAVAQLVSVMISKRRVPDSTKLLGISKSNIIYVNIYCFTLLNVAVCHQPQEHTEENLVRSTNVHLHRKLINLNQSNTCCKL